MEILSIRPFKNFLIILKCGFNELFAIVNFGFLKNGGEIRREIKRLI